jgi:hypothetical protein
MRGRVNTEERTKKAASKTRGSHISHPPLKQQPENVLAAKPATKTPSQRRCRTPMQLEVA